MIFRRAPLTEDSPIAVVPGIASPTLDRLEARGILTVRQLRRLDEAALERAGLNDFERHAVRVALAKFRPPTGPQAA